MIIIAAIIIAVAMVVSAMIISVDLDSGEENKTQSRKPKFVMHLPRKQQKAEIIKRQDPVENFLNNANG